MNLLDFGEFKDFEFFEKVVKGCLKDFQIFIHIGVKINHTGWYCKQYKIGIVNNTENC